MGDHFIIIFEAKSDKDPENGISVDNCRQTYGHYNWAKNDDFCQGVEKTIVVIASQSNLLENDSVPHTGELYYMNINRLREIFDIIAGIYRRIRTQLVKYDSETVRQMIFRELKNKNIDPGSLLKEFESNQLKDLPVLP